MPLMTGTVALVALGLMFQDLNFMGNYLQSLYTPMMRVPQMDDDVVKPWQGREKANEVNKFIGFQLGRQIEPASKPDLMNPTQILVTSGGQFIPFKMDKPGGKTATNPTSRFGSEEE